MGCIMAVNSVFILSKNKTYSYKNDDSSAEINVRNCIAFIRESPNSDSTHQISYHAHPDYEMHFIMEGECEFETDNGNYYKISKNQFVIIPPQKRHRIINESAVFSKMITEFEIKQDPDKENDFYTVFEKKLRNMEVLNAGDEVVFLVNTLVKNAGQKNHEYKSLISSMIHTYMIEIARKVVGNTKIQRKSEINDPRLQEAINYIKQNILNGITLEDVSANCFISTRQLTRIFKKYLDTTPSEYIRRIKIDCAERLLIETDIQISEIAEQLGFTEVTAFINFFRRYEDITPAKFRKRSR